MSKGEEGFWIVRLDDRGPDTRYKFRIGTHEVPDHELGLCLILDVVYNHFGRFDNFIKEYAPEWFDEEIVRQFYYENVRMWLEEFDFDGLRFDAVHEIKTDARDQFLGDLAKSARDAKSHAKLIIENMDNVASWLERDGDGQPTDFTAQWNDDIHHVLH